MKWNRKIDCPLAAIVTTLICGIVLILALTCAHAAILPVPVIYSASVTAEGKLTVKVNRYQFSPGPLLPPGADRILVTLYDVPDATDCCPLREIEGAPGRAAVVALVDPCDLDDPVRVGSLWVGVQFVKSVPAMTPKGQQYLSSIYGPSSALYKVNWTASWACVPSGY